jgi:membrane dipeptidase
MKQSPFIVDAHLDLAYNVARGRDITRPAAEQPVADKEIATVGFPDLHAGGIGLVCATIFCSPAGYQPGGRTEDNGYRDADGARAQALAQLATYRDLIDRGFMRFITSPDELPHSGMGVSPLQHGRDGHATEPLAAILLLEGADAIRTVDDLPEWFDAGLRIVGLAWKRTRYAGGTGQPGGLSPDGVDVVAALDRFGIIHDTSHLAELAFWQLLDASDGPVIATHSNCRAIVPTDRQLSDDMIKALVRRGGVIGMNFYDKFLQPPDAYGRQRCTLADLVAHVRHVCDLAGGARHVGIGTDLDGGLGREQIPREIVTIADLPKVADALSAAGFVDDDVRGIMGENWRTFFARSVAGPR